MAKNRFLSLFGISSSETFFSNRILLKNACEAKPFALIEITDDGREILRVGDDYVLGHVVVINE